MALDQWCGVQDVRGHEIGQLQRRLAPIRISRRNRDDPRGKLGTHQIKTSLRLRPCIDVGEWDGAVLGGNCDYVVRLRLVDCSSSLLHDFAASACCQSFASSLAPCTLPCSSRFRSMPVPARCGIQVLLTSSTRPSRNPAGTAYPPTCPLPRRARLPQRSPSTSCKPPSILCIETPHSSSVQEILINPHLSSDGNPHQSSHGQKGI